MRVVVALEHRFERSPDGAVWTQTMFAHPFWSGYLEVFDHVRVVARVRDVPAAPPGWVRADGRQVSFAAVPYYIGPWQYLIRAQRIQRAARHAVGHTDAVILRVCSQLAACIEPLLRHTSHPYGVQVVGDPYDIFSPGAVRHPLRPFFRWWFPRQLRRQCAGACAAAYVTQYTLQRRYPSAPSAFSSFYSDVALPEATFVPAPRAQRPGQRSFTLITVGSLAQLYKGTDVLIDATAACVQEGLDLKLIVVGDGKHRAELAAHAAALGLGERVCFRGQLTAGEAVRAELDQADVFVLPSRTEGLPRALIEAMARAMPCIGSTAGGMPELLAPEDMVPVGDVSALAHKIHTVVTDPQRMESMAARNLARARAYSQEVLRPRRIAFYRAVQERTEAWLTASNYEF